MNIPLISVIMPAYNAEKYISEAIESILNQTFENFEFIIIDDASTDGTWKIIKEYEKKDKRIIALQNKQNLKLSTSLNKCILKAKGKYIARMDADDWSYPYRLLYQFNYMEKNPDIGISGGTMEICDKHLDTFAKRKYQLKDTDIKKKIFLYSPFSHPLIIFRSKVLKKSGLYNPDFNPAEDYELYFRIGKISMFGNVPETLIKYRVIPNSMTTGATKKMELKTLSIRKKYGSVKPYSMSLFDRFYFLLEQQSIYIVPNRIRLWLFSLIRNSNPLEKFFNMQSFFNIILLGIIITGFNFRLNGIQNNHSFWADEAFISSISRDIAQQKLTIAKALSVGGQNYQPLSVLITAVSFKYLGISEFSARLPVVLFGTLSIFLAFLIAKKLSNVYGGLLAAFLIGFSELQLAHSTQAKPYIILQCILFIICYLLLQTQRSNLKLLTFHMIIVMLLILAPLIHYIGILFWVLYGVFILSNSLHTWRKLLRKPFLLLISVLFVIILGYLFEIPKQINQLFTSQNNKIIFIFNNTMYLKNLLIRQYGIFFIPASLSLLFLWKKHRRLVLSITVWMLVLIFMWNFRSYAHNIRYLVPLFGLTFVLFGVFWAKTGEKFTKKVGWLPCLLVTGLLLISQYKIVLTSQKYYSPNKDLYGDVQIANYKDLYQEIRIKIPDYKNIPIYTDIIDAHRWYMPEHMPDGYFMKGFGVTKVEKNNVDGKPRYHTLKQFLKVKKENSKGLLIVEDWESFLPEDIKQYAKKNIKRQIRIDSLVEAKNDPWPLEVYSWGL